MRHRLAAPDYHARQYRQHRQHARRKCQQQAKTKKAHDQQPETAGEKAGNARVFGACYRRRLCVRRRLPHETRQRIILIARAADTARDNRRAARHRQLHFAFHRHVTHAHVGTTL
jgi:hypothetical protein